MNEHRQSRIRVACALETPLMRQGIAFFIGTLQDMEWADDVGDALQIAEYCRRQAPDVVLVDLQLRTLSGLTLIREIRQEMPVIEVVALTTYNSEAQARAAIRAGAKGFLTKDAMPEELADTIRIVHAGQIRLPRAIVQLLGRTLAKYELSDREIEVLRLVAEFSATKTVAAQMNISEETVKVHIKHILEKMGARDRTHAVVMAIKQGLIPV
ncbi:MULTISPECIES: response regulator [Paraburkholderia]|jgi:DNA-binding NarL/FixJ family response regulator|uniref:Response regulator transcription factor n=1 Tax=Paraburkholderia madseniana TaxID=2599607 RepID=A0AAP5ET53_9BURK|nr:MULTISPECIES: response regulator transcription factor [Paraburkholderia]MCX4145033.1 response regulator transcription factor [Paraburkholderia madseniana]MCX4174575.1 response regulator transcription factor [Paraburkholderia madseniana]MDN7147985.1 response regulator transcription factor [Paraburkholderia sp. WS6]MDQ6406865.1 response regulator transcription factor [Paraburkholderia madseniana]MDQ6462576.1 response regulator transcription factor [Paraburkholderia madseniana]